MSLAIVVPVLGRPERAEPFMSSLRDSLPRRFTDTEVVVMGNVGEDDVTRAWDAEGVEVQLCSREFVSFPHKVQLAYEATDHDWLLLVGDDVHFHTGWYEAALAVMKRPEVGLISTNDMGNPYVMAGTHATHPIIRRAYVDERGSSWDGPYHIAHTGYRHSWLDEEWSTKAKFDGVFVYAPDCKIEHLHPTWSKGVQDNTYQIARDHLLTDHQLYVTRHDRAQLEGRA